MRATFDGARLVDADGEQFASRLTIEGGKLAAVGPDTALADTVIDAGEVVIVPGFVDVHTHGGGGFDLMTTEQAEIARYTRWVPETGTTALLATLIGVPNGLPLPQLTTVSTAIAEGLPGAEIAGIHLEAPYLNPKRRGAHDPSWLRLPNLDEVEQLLAAAGGHLRLITMAPELPGAYDVMPRLVAAGVTVSIGHTDATYEEAHRAVELGARHGTHCFNAMRPLHHRDPGPLAAIVEAPRVNGELIADGIHVHPAAMRLLVRALGFERTIVITDSIATAGTSGGTFSLGGQPVTISNGRAELADGTLAGSVLTMDQALRNMVELVGVPLPRAVAMLTANPARAAGVDSRKGRLIAGYDADLVVLNQALEVQATICRGEVAFATPEWRAKLAPLLTRSKDDR